MNAQRYALNNGQYIRVLTYAYMRLSLLVYDIAIKMILPKNCQYDGSCKMPCLGISVISLMFVTAALSPVTTSRNSYACFEWLILYPHTDHKMAENLIVRREVAVDSVRRWLDSGVQSGMLREFCLLNCWWDTCSTYYVNGKCFQEEQIHALHYSP